MSKPQGLSAARDTMTAFLQGDVRAVLKTLPDESVQCVVTSPPYFGLRNYNVEGQIGQEPTPEEYVAELVVVFREVRRVLREDGVCWLNLGDSYAGPGSGPQGTSGQRNGRTFTASVAKKMPAGLKAKDLLMIPARVAIALQADGWYLRSNIIWQKPNPMPESAKDRPTSAHESVFLLSKNERYFYDAFSIEEPASAASAARYAYGFGGAKNKALKAGDKPTAVVGNRSFGGGRNARNVWTITTKPCKEAHFATFPIELPTRCIKAGTSEHGCCPECRSPFKRIVEKGEPDREHQRACGGDSVGEYAGVATKDYAAAGAQDASATKARILAGMREKKTVGWTATCKCQTTLPPVPCLVLDPFAGAGTTMLACQQLGRDSVGIELNPDYVDIARKRVGTGALSFFVWDML